jgi:predicted transcriptional regulator
MEITHSEFAVDSQTLEVSLDEELLKNIAKAISSPTRLQILKNLNVRPMDVSELAKALDQTEANISAQIKILDQAGLITCRYEPGDHGVRKINEVTYRRLAINLF